MFFCQANNRLATYKYYNKGRAFTNPVRKGQYNLYYVSYLLPSGIIRVPNADIIYQYRFINHLVYVSQTIHYLSSAASITYFQ